MVTLFQEQHVKRWFVTIPVLSAQVPSRHSAQHATQVTLFQGLSVKLIVMLPVLHAQVPSHRNVKYAKMAIMDMEINKELAV